MRTLLRERNPGVIHANFTGNLKIELERDLLLNRRLVLRGESEKQSFDSSRWKKAKDQLKAETCNKCAYCEAPTSMVAYGDVEHYRPKSHYWWLAYSYENYLVSCQLCNQKYKKAKFPVKNSRIRGPVVRRNSTDDFIENLAGTIAPDPLNQQEITAFLQDHQQERPFLLNPYFDDAVTYYAWKADDVLSEVELVPAPPASQTKPYVDAAIKYYGLNRQELKDARFFYYSLFRLLKNTLQDPGISADTHTQTSRAIQTMKAGNAPFTGMIRYFDNII